ncbi:unnamed protein product [Rhizopus stolonifer]
MATGYNHSFFFSKLYFIIMYSSVPTSQFAFTFCTHVPSTALIFSFSLLTVMQSTAVFVDDPMDVDADTVVVDNPLEMGASIIQEN